MYERKSEKEEQKLFNCDIKMNLKTKKNLIYKKIL